MRKMIALTAAVAALAAPAFAASMTLEFASAEGEALVMTLNDDGTYTLPDGTTGAYTWDEATSTLCGDLGEENVCATIEGASEEPAVGDSASYTATNGNSGTVTVMAIAE